MALVAVVPEKLGERLGRLQRALDPAGPEQLPPHIPLAGPFEVAPPFLPLEQHCWRSGHENARGWVELGPVVIEGGVAALPVTSGREQLAGLRAALLGGAYPLPEEDGPYEPRAVVGRSAVRDDFAVATFEEQTGGPNGRTFLLERFELMARYPDGSWYQRDFYTLDRAVART